MLTVLVLVVFLAMLTLADLLPSLVPDGSGLVAPLG